MKKGLKLGYSTIGIPPNILGYSMHTFRHALIKVREILETNDDLESSHVLTADFNMPIISWSTREMCGGGRGAHASSNTS